MSKELIVLILTSIIMTFSSFDERSSANQCDELIVTKELIHTTNNLSNGQIAINVKGGNAPYIYVFVDKTHKTISSNFKSNKLSGLVKGTYYCTVYDKKGCSKLVQVDIK